MAEPVIPTAISTDRAAGDGSAAALGAVAGGACRRASGRRRGGRLRRDVSGREISAPAGIGRIDRQRRDGKEREPARAERRQG